MLLGHLLCGVLFGLLVAAACLAIQLSLATAVLAYVVGSNVGFVAGLAAPPS